MLRTVSSHFSTSSKTKNLPETDSWKAPLISGRKKKKKKESMLFLSFLFGWEIMSHNFYTELVHLRFREYSKKLTVIFETNKIITLK